jgi:pimeloyl-ACP methyl ester carboxylesterase
MSGTAQTRAAPRVQTVSRGDVTLALYAWGRPRRGQAPILLIHGYPDNAHVWTATAEALAANHAVYAYDVRGAGRSTRPTATADYRFSELMADLNAVIDTISPDQPVHLVGHDWGSIQGWEAVCTPELAVRIASYTSISGPSLDHAGDWMRRRLGTPARWSQLVRQFGHSWYVMLFQLPAVAPAVWRLALGRRWTGILSNLEGIEAEPNPTQTEDGRYGVALYRANFPPKLARPQPRPTGVPVQLIVPTQDPFMVNEIWDDLPMWVPNLTRREIDAGHWLPLSDPAYLADCIDTFVLCQSDTAAPTPARRRRRTREKTA